MRGWITPDGRTIEVVTYADDGTTGPLTFYRVRHPSGPQIADVMNVGGLTALGIDLATLAEYEGPAAHQPTDGWTIPGGGGARC